VPPLLQIFLIFVGSLAAGVFGALLGLGGGVLLVPMLTLLFGFDFHIAVGASIVGVIATSSGAASAYLRDHLTNVRLGMTLELATTVGALVGGTIAGYLGHDVLALLFGLVLFYTSFSMARGNPELAVEEPRGKPTAADGASYNIHSYPAGMAVAAFAGSISGLLGIGGGIIKVPAMYLLMGVPLRIAAATSNFMVGVTAAASAFVYYARGDIHPLIAGPTALGVYVGALFGTRIGERFRNRGLEWLFAVVLALVAISMISSGLHLSLGA
jgi:uncharacterized membrane protein YfcA